MNLKDIPYYIGLDCGTSSVGFAVTDKSYNLLRAKHKDMWGSHLFDEAQTAENRRIQRNARKRLHRQKERIKLLQSIFAEEIGKIDPTFFLRLNESSLLQEDRSNNNKQPFTLFNDDGYTDKEFYQRYKTIYHLRSALIEGTAENDPRLVYLALQHIIKNRGHFLFPGENFSAVNDINSILSALKDSYYAIFEEELTIDNTDSAIEQALMEKKKADRLEKLNEKISATDDKRRKQITRAMIGYSVSVYNIFSTDENECEEYKELPKLDFSKSSFEEQSLPTLEDSLTEDEYKLVESLKALYDWSLLASIMAGETSISKAKIRQYEKNKEDRDRLKRVVRKYAPEVFESFFYSEEDGTFSRYTGSIHSNKCTEKKIKHSNTDDFYKSIRAILKNADPEDLDVKQILEDIDNDSFMPLLRSFRNGVVPYQVNLCELRQILTNAAKTMPWLLTKDKNGFTPEEKIISIMKFRIPYYVGPLTDNANNRNAWMVRKEEGAILPWNFESKVDISRSAENFIQRMTNKCTYIPTEDVIPKQSLLYQKYMVLNEINNIKINSMDITVEQKQVIFELFKEGNVTQNKIKKLIVAKGWIKKGESISLSGIDTTIKSNLSSYIAFREYLESGKLSVKEVETIIRWLTLFSDGGNIARERIETSFKDKLTPLEIQRICRMKFGGWGNFSQKFLTGLEAMNPETGELTNIIDILWTTNLNLMEVIHHPAIGIKEQLDYKRPIESLSYSIIEDLRISPKVKRQIWQALKIVKELEHVMGHKPEKVFIEVARYEGEKGKRTKTRKDQLLDLLKNDKDPETKEIIKSIESTDASLITKRDKLYLYYTQLGKCMYSGEPIDLEDLLTTSHKYDIDHIYPYSKSDDDSLDNKVIVKSTLNREKSNVYPLTSDIQTNMVPFWKKLLDMKLISSEKFHRLTRSTPLSEDDFNGFINRQIVETSQSTIALARILEQYFGDETKIVYSKAGNVSEFRKLFELPKSRIINDLHHAKDAYLNIVVGNTLNTKYTEAFFKRTPNFNNKYKYNVAGAWIADNDETITLVKKTLDTNNILFTRQPEMRTGQLFDLNPVAKGAKAGMLPVKITTQLKEALKTSSDKDAIYKAWTDKYGGYNSIAISHFALIRRKDKKNTVYTFVTIPMIRRNELLDKEKLYSYCTNELGYKNVEIVRVKVLFNTLLSVDGFLMTITNSMNRGATLGLELAVPLLLDNEATAYIKKLEKFNNKKKIDKNPLVDEKYDEISKEKNIELYNLIVKKIKLQIYKNRPGSALDIIEKGKDVFLTLTTEQQVSILINILGNYTSMTNGTTDLRLIGGGKANGTLTLGTSINPQKKKVILINQSITGIYEERFELK